MVSKTMKLNSSNSSASLMSFLPLIATAPDDTTTAANRKMSIVGSLKGSDFDFEISEIYDHVNALPDIKKLAKAKQLSNRNNKNSNSSITLSMSTGSTTSGRISRIMKQKAKTAKRGDASRLLEQGDEAEEENLSEFYIKLATPKTFYYFPSKGNSNSRSQQSLNKTAEGSPSASLVRQATHIEIKENLIKELGVVGKSDSKCVKHLFFPELADKSSLRTSRAARDRLTLKSGLLENPNGSYFLQSVSYLNIKNQAM
jgi:hypothetical protein